MNKKLEKYFIPNKEASYVKKDGKRCLVAPISYKGKKTKRAMMAHIQRDLRPVSVDKTIAYVNSFLDELKTNSDKKYTFDKIELDGIEHTIIDNCIIVKGCKWDETIWKKSYDVKYDIIKKKFDLQNVWDIIWLKFAIDPDSQEKYLGVVALGNDISFSYKLSSGKLLIEVGQKWDESFVCIFPLTKDILNQNSRKSIETGIGNYLIENKVPIIDYYSHNNFN